MFIMDKHKPAWFQNGVLYQIYPRSFYDANGDGVGDLAGITAKLDYLRGSQHSLCVDGIWISPFYPSPMADFGYDVANYCDVDPLFGTLADFDELLAGAHKRGLKVMIDFVPNHSSSQHPWFLESKADKTNPRRDWYIWKDAKDGGSLPNNWQSWFGGPAWRLDETTGQYYLHTFLAEQPDLNWANPEVRATMREQLRFWLDRGVDGVRVDAVWWLSKDPDFRDDPDDNTFTNSRGGPKLYHYLNELVAVVKAYPGRFMVTEGYPIERGTPRPYLPFYRRLNPEITAPFNFEAIHLPWKARAYQKFINQYQAATRANDIPIYVLGNHDKPRLASRIGQPAARTAAMLLLTLPGMPFIYNGDELGMENVVVPPERQQDTVERHGADAPGSRDGERTPMQWSGAPNAGFTTGQPWLPLEDNWKERNVAVEANDPASLLELYRSLIKLRHEQPALRDGDYRPIASGHPDVMAFERRSSHQRLMIFLNFEPEPAECKLSTPIGQLLLSTTGTERQTDIKMLALQPHEGIIIEAQA